MLVETLPVAGELLPYVQTLLSIGHCPDPAFDAVFNAWVHGDQSDPDLYERDVFEHSQRVSPPVKKSRNGLPTSVDCEWLGKDVRICALRKQYELNGKRGHVVEVNEQTR